MGEPGKFMSVYMLRAVVSAVCLKYQVNREFLSEFAMNYLDKIPVSPL